MMKRHHLLPVLAKVRRAAECDRRCWLTFFFTIAPYGLPAALELLRVLINLIDPNDKQHTDSTRLTALSVVSTAFEVAGHVIRQVDDLRSMVVDRGCKFLLLLARSEHPALLYLSLRVLSTMFETMRPYLKLQQELFLAFTLDRLAPPPPVAAKVAPGRPVPTTPNGGSQAASPSIAQLPDDGTSDASSIPAPRPTALPARGETRELLLGTLTHMCRSPSFLVDLFVNYDCDLNCENLVERLIAFCTKVHKS
jgi:golgi-specific brefeldin A-resistance guanine nucleotide exchange factor 1